MRFYCTLIGLILYATHVIFSNAYHELVNDLKNYVNSNETFALQINDIFKEANTPKLTYNDIYEFFDYYIDKAPSGGKHFYFNITLQKFLLSTKTGSIICSSRKGQQWFKRYMHTVKQFCDSPLSTYVISEWENRPDVNMTQYIIPKNGFHSFNDFFTRKINPKYRPIDSPNDNTVIVSPCDGQVVEIETDLRLNKNYTMKGINYSLSTMLMNDYYAERFVGGTLIQIYLMAGNYHRFHSSVSGYISQVDQIGGFEFWLPINYADGYQTHTDGYFKFLVNNNRRGILYIETDKFGVVAHNYVGIWLVNSVKIHVDIGMNIEKGDETGFFQYGGSTIAVLFAKHAIKDIVVKKKQNVTIGERIAIANVNFDKMRENESIDDMIVVHNDETNKFTMASFWFSCGVITAIL